MSSPPNSPDTAKPRAAPWIYLVLLASFLLYVPSVANDFTWDDRWAAMADNGTVQNPLVSEVRPLSEYFESHYWPHKTKVSHAYRPVTVLSYALGHAAFGDSAIAAHLINVLLHVLAVGLCIALVLGLGFAWPAACVAGLVFGVHAIHSEVVANVVGRAELLSFVLGAGALLLARRAAGAGKHRWWIYPSVAALLFLSFGSKESALAWAAFVPLYLVAQPRSDESRWTRTDVAALAVAILVPAVAILALRHGMISRLPGGEDPTVGWLENPLLHAATSTRVLTGIFVWGYGLWLTLFPFHLSADYGPSMLPVIEAGSALGVACSVLIGIALVTLVIAGIRCRKSHPALFLAVAVFFGFSFIVTNIPLPVFMMFAERTYYTPSLGLALLVAWAAARYGKTARPALVLAFGMWIGVSSLVAFRRNFVWRDDATLIAREVLDNPGSLRMQLCAGELWKNREAFGAAEHYFKGAAKLDPRYPLPWMELARLAIRRNDPSDAQRFLANARKGRTPALARVDGELKQLETRLRALREARSH